MNEWILVFIMSTGGSIGTTTPMAEAECLKWQARMKPEQHAVCIRIIQTVLGPYTERKP